MRLIKVDASFREGWCAIAGVSEGELLFRTVLPADGAHQAEGLALTHAFRVAEARDWHQVIVHTDSKGHAGRLRSDSSGFPRENWHVKKVPRRDVAEAHALALSELRIWFGGDQ
jgi:ribonuclease HI